VKKGTTFIVADGAEGDLKKKYPGPDMKKKKNL
jgi:hypothetical protein